MFRNKHNPEHRMIIYTEAGTDIVPVFALSDDESMVIQVGKRSIKDEINSFKDSTDLEVIKKQLLVGNVTVTEAFNNSGFKAPESAFGDATLFPETMSEYKRIMDRAIKQYNTIPKEIREQFNTIDDFVNASDDKLQSIFDNYNAKLQSKDNSDVKVEQNEESAGDL